MGAMTIWGTATRIGGLAAELSSSGRIIGGHSYDEIALELPEDGILVDLDHAAGTECGELVYGEVAPDSRVNVVAVLDDDRISRIDQDVYFSCEMAMFGDHIRDRSSSYIADRAMMIGLGLTMSPLTVAATPIRWRSGDVRRSSDRFSWPVSWRSADELLGRALDHVGGQDLRTRTRHLVDRRPRDDDYPGLREGQHVAPGQVRSGQLPNGLRIAGAAGRVLRVS
jgi:hypothetical protein